MAKKVITCGLSESSINNAIAKLRSYQTFLNNKTLEFVKALVESGIPVVEANMARANYTYDSKGTLVKKGLLERLKEQEKVCQVSYSYGLRKLLQASHCTANR